ncbi:hypothetical protein ACFQL1_19085 [Halomicroarcula sp. GCM10025709]|uniref:hypothetical protein n=1 Tax=Halomicroarcula sp. GCM10025709 TaxID=3252669 RepID=UPI00360AE07D
MDDWLEGRIHGDDGISAKFKRVDSEFKSVLQSDRCADDSNFVFDLDDAGAADAGQLQADLAAHTTVRMVRGRPTATTSSPRRSTTPNCRPMSRTNTRPTDWSFARISASETDRAKRPRDTVPSE